MAENDSEVKYYYEDSNLEEPYNPTDLVVYLDKTKQTKVIAKKYHEQDKEGDLSEPQPDLEEDSFKVHGKLIPIININGLVISENILIYMALKFDSMTPSLELSIIDNERKIINKNIPLINNFIDVILVPTIENAYKNISLSFYVTNFYEQDINGNHYITYFCDYKCNELNNTILKQIIFPGCNTDIIQKEENDKPSTWEYLYTIALDNGLGFAATPDLCEHHDNLARLIQSETILQFINRQSEFAGKDIYNMIDIWIDEYEYLCAANIYWLLNNNNVRHNNLTILKSHMPDVEFSKSPDKNVHLAGRVISNYKKNTEYSNDLYIAWYQVITDTSSTYYDGTFTQTFSLKPAGSECNFNNDNDPVSNSFVQIDYQLEDNNSSKDAMDEYNTSSTVIVKSEFNEYQTEAQKLIKEKYFNKIRSEILKVRIQDVNYGLHRGMLVNVAIFTDEKDESTKLSILDEQEGLIYKLLDQLNSENNQNIILNDEQKKTIENNSDIKSLKMELASNPEIQIPKTNLCGMYYIDKIEYIYDPNCFSGYVDNNIKKDIKSYGSIERIHQYLYLIKMTKK